jgi:hypothetical protein
MKTVDFKSSELSKDKDTFTKDALMQSLKSKTPAEIDTWIDINVTDINSTKQLLKSLTKIMSHIVKRI